MRARRMLFNGRPLPDKRQTNFRSKRGQARRAKANQQWLPAEQGSLNIRIL